MAEHIVLPMTGPEREAYRRDPILREMLDGDSVRALVHATLALAEQQRIANLIALTALGVHQRAVGYGHLEFELLYDHPEDLGHGKVKAEVLAALGLS